MRAYRAWSEEALLIRNLLKDWARQGLLTEAQYQRMQQDIVCDLRRTNVYLRLVLFFFTTILVAGVSALFVLMLPSQSATQPVGMGLLMCAVVSYAGAEFIAARGFYRYGMEEALAGCSVALLCTGILAALLPIGPSSLSGNVPEVVAALLGAISSLWIWHRFGFPFAFLAAMLFVAWLASCWTSSHQGQRLITAVLYATGLLGVAKQDSRRRLASLHQRYAIAEALLWLGVYLTFNLQLVPSDWLTHGRGSAIDRAGVSSTFYWASWLMTWSIPPAALFRGLVQKNRLVIAVGGVAAIVTLITNKPYLGWQRHVWDPMLLGALLIGAAIVMHRWLSKRPDGIRHGLTARPPSGKDNGWLTPVSIALGLISPHQTLASPQTHPATSDPGPRYGGGDFGGGGASSDF